MSSFGEKQWAFSYWRPNISEARIMLSVWLGSLLINWYSAFWGQPHVPGLPNCWMPRHDYILVIGANMAVFDRRAICKMNFFYILHGRPSNDGDNWKTNRTPQNEWLISDQCSGTSTKVVIFASPLLVSSLRKASDENSYSALDVDSIRVIRFNGVLCPL